MRRDRITAIEGRFEKPREATAAVVKRKLAIAARLSTISDAEIEERPVAASVE